MQDDTKIFATEKVSAGQKMHGSLYAMKQHKKLLFKQTSWRHMRNNYDFSKTALQASPATYPTGGRMLDLHTQQQAHAHLT
jgi:hypothetical protein